MIARGAYNQPVRNVSGEAVPPFAVMQVAGFVEFAGRDWFTVVKPDGDGKIYLVNGPTEIPASGDSATGAACLLTRDIAAHALYDETPETTGDPVVVPAINEEWGPKAGSWRLHRGQTGFLIIGDVQGESASAPGLPVVASTKRVRVAAAPGETQVDDIIVGRTTDAVAESQETFAINRIQVESGVDPRTNPNDPFEAVTIQNTFAENYPVDKSIRAKRNKTTGLWHVIKQEAGGSAIVYGKLLADLSIFSASVQFQAKGRGDGGSINELLTGLNPTDIQGDAILDDDPPRYVFAGNVDGWCVAVKMTTPDRGEGWYFVGIQEPYRIPVV